MANANTGRPQRNSRGSTSAASFAGCVGLPEPGRGPMYGDGGLRTFCLRFNRRFDELAATSRPEWRSFARAEREIKAL